jgi:Flp pilus assembly pilin Flp
MPALVIVAREKAPVRPAAQGFSHPEDGISARFDRNATRLTLRQEPVHPGFLRSFSAGYAQKRDTGRTARKGPDLSQRLPRLAGKNRPSRAGDRTQEQRPDRVDTVADVTPSTHERAKTMNMLNLLKRFKKDEDGAVTVDWVVLTAAIVGLGLIVMAAIRPAITGLSSSIATEIGEADDNF